MEIVSLFVVFKRQTNVLSGCCSLSTLFNFSESEAFAGEALALGDISFLILLSLVWTSDIFSLLTLKTCILWRIPLRTNIADWLTNHRLFRILLILFDWSTNQIR